jgi:hypothetical protein
MRRSAFRPTSKSLSPDREQRLKFACVSEVTTKSKRIDRFDGGVRGQMLIVGRL